MATDTSQGKQSKSTSLSDMWSGVQNAAGKNPATEKLLGAAQNFVGAQAQKAMTSVGEKAGGITQKLTDFSEGNSEGMSGLLGKGAEKVAQGDDPGKAMVKAGGEQIKDKVKNVFSRGKSSGNPKVINIIEDINIGVSSAGGLRPVDAVAGVLEVHEGHRERRGHRGNEVELARQDLVVQAELAGDDHRGDPDQRIAWTSEGAKGQHEGRHHLPHARRGPDQGAARARVLPAGVLREDRQHLARRRSPRAARPQALPPLRHDPGRGDSDSWRAEVQDGEIVRTHDEVVEEEERQRDEQDQPASRASRSRATSVTSSTTRPTTSRTSTTTSPRTSTRSGATRRRRRRRRGRRQSRTSTTTSPRTSRTRPRKSRKRSPSPSRRPAGAGAGVAADAGSR